MVRIFGLADVRNALALTAAQFHQMVDEHGAVLYRMAYRLVGDQHEAEDLVQEAFRSAWKSRQHYQSGRGDRAWLAAILRRRAVDRWRKSPPPSVVSSEETLDRAVPADDPFAEEFSDDIQHALQRLPQELRETLLLVVVADLTHQEVANMLEIPLGTVLSRVSRARARLRDYLVTVRA